MAIYGFEKNEVDARRANAIVRNWAFRVNLKIASRSRELYYRGEIYKRVDVRCGCVYTRGDTVRKRFYVYIVDLAGRGFIRKFAR